mgnify:FL=1
MAMILVFITCKNQKEAQEIGLSLLKKRLAGCMVVIPKVSSAYFWPPKKGRIEKWNEAILLVKTLKKKFPQVRHEVKRLHSYTMPCILEIPIGRTYRPYLRWLESELKEVGLPIFL